MFHDQIQKKMLLKTYRNPPEFLPLFPRTLNDPITKIKYRKHRVKISERKIQYLFNFKQFGSHSELLF